MYLNEIVFNHHSFVSIHWELLREESDCKAVSQDKVREAAEYCIALHLLRKKTKTESLKHTVLKQTSIGFFHWSISLKPLIKSPRWGMVLLLRYQVLVLASYAGFRSSRLFWKWRYTGSAATWLLESQIYYNNQILNGDALVVGIEI